MDDVRFKINGEELPFPSLASLTFADAVIVNRVTGLSVAEVYTAPVETRIAAQIGVALMRAHADWGVQQVAESVLFTDMSQFEWVGLPEAADTSPLSASETSDETGTPASTANATESDERSA